jgi:mRNA interferase MazF
MRRGDLVTVAMAGDFGKPRPALVVQADQFDQTGTITVLLVSGTLVDAPLIRVTVQPTPDNGLHKISQIMTDKAMSVKRAKLEPPFGRLDDESMLAVTRSLALFLGIA